MRTVKQEKNSNSPSNITDERNTERHHRQKKALNRAKRRTAKASRQKNR